MVGGIWIRFIYDYSVRQRYVRGISTHHFLFKYCLFGNGIKRLLAFCGGFSPFAPVHSLRVIARSEKGVIGGFKPCCHKREYGILRVDYRSL